ncbi:MAG: CPCC family cysteine-rich protein, partial [Planctomycetales bacterium]
ERHALPDGARKGFSMTDSISRDDAIKFLCDADLESLTRAQRAEQLDCMLREDWESDPSWKTIPADIRAEFENDGDEDHEIEQPSDEKYDPVLRLWLRWRYSGARNEFLVAQLRNHGCDYQQVIGEPALLVACPCCGRCTLDQHGDYDICPVCWWEDSGQDNHNAEMTGGPNGRLSLTCGRINYLTSGISEPSRDDLRKLQEPADKYPRGRIFVLSDDGRSVSEPSADWRDSLDNEAN